MYVRVCMYASVDILMDGWMNGFSYLFISISQLFLSFLLFFLLFLGNGLSYQKERNFSTFDRDLDKSSVNCASVCKGAWWYTSCHISNLNGLYLRGDHSPYANGMSWTPWKGPYYSLKKSAMKIRPSPSLA